ncbi:hypothetical protein ABGB12_18650 [Actinocorallia sp. B10E7]|uniref:hypothetical protein n=1 Tax=Actinocorallia sp. B10E7 TaxID=3153558 RepID=UPI00325DEFBB
MWLKALVAVAPLATMLGAGVPAQAKAAAAPQITPASGSVITSSSVTIRVKSAVGGGTLYVDGRPVRTGKNTWLTHTINGKTTPNGTVKVKLEAVLPWDEASSTFRMAVPASAPSGVTASVTGNNKVTVRWNKGTEPDLTGYTLSSDFGTRNVSAASCGAQCSVTLTAPATAGGQATIQVVAKRAGAAASGASTRTVKLKGTGQPPSNNGNAPAPAPAPSNYTWPNPPQSTVFPTVAPDPGGFSTDPPEVSVYPTPTDPAVLDPSVVSLNSTGLTGTMADESLQWGKSMAIALVLLLCAAHLGTWTRRLRTARAIGPGGPRLVSGSAHARVEANRMHIEAALAAARGAVATKDAFSDEDGQDGKKSKRGGRFKKHKASAPEPEAVELGSLVREADPDQEFPDELNLEYTPKRTPDTDSTDEADPVDTDVTSFDLDELNVDKPDLDEPSPGTTVLDRSEQDPDGVRKADEEKADAALAALIELAKSDVPEPAQEPAEEDAGDRTEVLESPRRRRGLFRR